MLAHTFLAVTAHKAKKRGPNKPNNQTDRIIHPTSRPNPKPRHPSIDDLSRSPSLKSADSSTSSTAANTASPTACTGQPGAADTKPRPAEPTSDATSACRR